MHAYKSLTSKSLSRFWFSSFLLRMAISYGEMAPNSSSLLPEALVELTVTYTKHKSIWADIQLNYIQSLALIVPLLFLFLTFALLSSTVLLLSSTVLLLFWISPTHSLVFVFPLGGHPCLFAQKSSLLRYLLQQF